MALIEACLSGNVAARPTAAQLVEALDALQDTSDDLATDSTVEAAVPQLPANSRPEQHQQQRQQETEPVAALQLLQGCDAAAMTIS